MNKIIIKNLKIFAYHGVHNTEKVNGQNFFIDVECYIRKTKGFKTDNILDTVSYSDVIKSIKKIMLKKSNNLLEYTSEKIARQIFSDFVGVYKIKLVLKKPEAPINEHFDYVGIKIIRTRSDYKNV